MDSKSSHFSADRDFSATGMKGRGNHPVWSSLHSQTSNPHSQTYSFNSSYHRLRTRTYPGSTGSRDNTLPMTSGGSVRCRLCDISLHHEQAVQDHLASRMHLDMIIKHPELPFQDLLVLEQNVDETDRNMTRETVDYAGSGYGTSDRTQYHSQAYSNPHIWVCTFT